MPGTGVRLGAGGGALPRRLGPAGVQGRHRRPEVSGLHHSEYGHFNDVHIQNSSVEEKESEGHKSSHLRVL